MTEGAAVRWPGIECRPYRRGDRSAVREICCETGHLGDPIDPYFGDREVFADFVTLWYTDVDPAWSFVAVDRGRVVGYLLGCADSMRYNREAPRLWRRLALKAVARGVILRPSTAPMASRLLVDFLTERPSFGWYGERFPAHLHINLLPEARGRGAGRMLMEAFCGALQSAGVPGVFLETSCENERAVAFFEAMGFEPLHAAPSPGGRSADGGRLHVLGMGMRLS